MDDAIVHSIIAIAFFGLIFIFAKASADAEEEDPVADAWKNGVRELAAAGMPDATSDALKELDAVALELDESDKARDGRAGAYYDGFKPDDLGYKPSPTNHQWQWDQQESFMKD